MCTSGDHARTCTPKGTPGLRPVVHPLERGNAIQIHTDTLTGADIYRAVAELPGVYVDYTEHGSRSRARKFNVTLTAEPRKGRHTRNSGTHGALDGEAAATWDEWGVFLARLFDIDPNAHCWAYESAEHFHWATAGRFRNGGPDVRHDQHRWELQGTVVTGAHHVHECKCGAIRRYMAYGRSFSELQAA